MSEKIFDISGWVGMPLVMLTMDNKNYSGYVRLVACFLSSTILLPLVFIGMLIFVFGVVSMALEKIWYGL